jgi:hypothetical protein
VQIYWVIVTFVVIGHTLMKLIQQLLADDDDDG